MKAIPTLSVGIAVTVLDQLLKYAIARNDVYASLLSLIGISYAAHPWSVPALSVDPRIYSMIAFLTLAVACFFLFRYALAGGLQWALILLLGGGASNLLDHILRNEIVETLFILDFQFNVADIALLTSGLLAFHYLLKHFRTSAPVAEEESSN